MRIKSGKYIFPLVLGIMISLSGCYNNSEYYKLADEFNAVYFETVECIDLKNTKKSLLALQTEKNSENINKLGKLLEQIGGVVPKGSEILFMNYKQRYEDLIFLKDAYAKFDTLSTDDRGRIGSALLSIGLDKANWKDKDSSRVWR